MKKDYLPGRRVIRQAVALSLLLTACSYLFWPSREVSAVSRTWDGGGGTNNWSEAANWSNDTVPGAGDIAVFNSTSVKNATINVDIDVLGIQMASGYTGTVTQGGGRDITLGSSGFSQAAGFFAGANLLAPIDINGPFTLSGGQFTSTGANLSVSGDFTISGGTFISNGSKVTFDGGNATINILNNEFFFNMSFSADDQATKTITMGDTLTVSGTLDLIDGNINGGTINAQSNVYLDAGADGGSTTINISGGTTTLNAGGILPAVNLVAPGPTVNTAGTGAVNWDGSFHFQAGTINQGAVDLRIFDYTQTGGTLNGGSATLDIESFQLFGGTFTSTTGDMSVGGNYTHGGGVFNHNNGKVFFDGGNATIDVPSTETFNDLGITSLDQRIKTIAGSDTLIVTGNLSLSDGNINTGTIEAQSGVSVSGSFDGGTGALNITGAATRTVLLIGGCHLPKFTVNAANVTVDTSGTGTVVAEGEFKLQAGTVNQGSLFFALQTAYTQTGGVFNGGAGAIDVDAFTLSGGTFTSSQVLLQCSGNYTHAAGATFNHNGGLVRFSGGSSAIDVPTTATFNNLAFASSNQVAKTIPLGDTLVVTGTLNLEEGEISGGIVNAQGAIIHNLAFDGGDTLLLISGATARTVTFNAGVLLPNVQLSAPAVTINTAGTGTVTCEGNFTFQGGLVNLGTVSLSIQADYSQTSGTFNGGSGNVMVLDDFTQSGGTFNAPTGTLFIGGDITHTSGGVFNNNTATVELNGGNAFINVNASETFNNLTFNSPGGVSKSIASGVTLVVTGTLKLLEGSIDGSGGISAQGPVIHDSFFDGGSGTLTITGAAARTITLNGGGQMPETVLNAPNVTVNTAVGLIPRIAWEGPLTIQAGVVNQGAVEFAWQGFTQSGGAFNGSNKPLGASVFQLSAGTFTSTSDILSITAGYTHTGGTFNPNSGTVRFSGGNPTTIDVPTSETFNNLSFNLSDGSVKTVPAGDTLIVNGMLTLEDGNINGGTIDARGGITHDGKFDGGTTTLTITGAAARAITLNAGGQLPKTTLNAANVAVSCAGTGAITWDGDFTFTAGTFNQAGGALVMPRYIQDGISAVFNGGTAAINTGDLTISGGTFNSTTGNLFVTGNFTHTSGGTFNHNSGTVSLSGGAAAVNVNTSEQFRNLTISADTGTIKTISNGDTLIVTGTLALTDGNIDGGTVNAQAGMTHTSGFDGGTSTITITGTSARTISLAAGGRVPNVTLNAANVTINMTAGAGGGGVICDGTFTLQAGVVNQGPASFSCVTGFTQSGGLFNGSSTSIQITNFVLSGGTFNSTSNNLDIIIDFTHTSGGVFNHNSGTLVFSSNVGTIDVNVSETLNNLKFDMPNSFIRTIAAGDTLKALGTTTFNRGFVNGGVIEAQGNVVVNSGALGGTAAMLFSGSANQTFTNLGGVIIGGNWTVGKSSGKVTLASDLTLGASQPLSIVSGTLDQGAAFNLSAGAISIGAGGALKNLGTGDLTLSGNVSNNGLIELNGGGINCGDADSILIRSSSAGTGRAWSGTGTFALTDVEVRDQAGSAMIEVLNGTDSGNNGKNWDFNPTCTPTPTDYVVNSSADTNDGSCDSGNCTLREAIVAANIHPGLDRIAFNIGVGPKTINVSGAALPSIIDSVRIDATSQPGFTGAPILELNGAGAGPNVTGLKIEASNCIIKGLVINRFSDNGIRLDDANDNVIEGNYIGTNLAGTLDQGNANDGIALNNSSNNTIGGTAVESRNVISGNGRDGISITGSSLNSAQGNYVGTDKDGNAAIGNTRHGLFLQAALNNSIGGTASGAGNRIAFNGGSGISIIIDSTGNGIKRNSIFSNTGLGIDLGNNGLTANDAGDADTGANNYQNFPVLVSATPGGNNINIQGTLNSAPNSSFTIEFFSNPQCGLGEPTEGETFLGSAIVATDRNGNASFDVTVPNPGGGQSITATASDSANNTSEFSACVEGCAFTITPIGSMFTARGGTGEIKVLPTSLCNWTVIPSDNWVVLTSAPEGMGEGTVTFEVRENPMLSARQCTLNVAGRVFTIVQEGTLTGNCSNTISPLFAAYSGS